MLETLVLDRPEQLKALGHPLRVRVLEMLGGDEEWQLTNRELAQRLAVDPGHLHFHVRMLLRAGLIELVDDGKKRGREKPYRAVARTFRVAPELLASGGASDLQAGLLDQVQRGHSLFASEGRFRGAQLELRLPIDRAQELALEFLARARELEEPDADNVVVTVFTHPPAPRD